MIINLMVSVIRKYFSETAIYEQGRLHISRLSGFLFCSVAKLR